MALDRFADGSHRDFVTKGFSESFRIEVAAVVLAEASRYRY